MIATKNLTLVVIFLSLLLTEGLLERLQRIRFFTNNQCNPTPTPVEFTESRNVSGSGSTPFQSYCVISGAWRVEYAWVMHASDYMISLGDGCAICIKPSSTRGFGVIVPISGKDLTKPSFSLYGEKAFAGREVTITTDVTFESTQSFLSFAFGSYNNWTWQTYNLPHYRGNSTCYKPTSGAEVSLFESTSISVGSIRLGCRNAANTKYKNLGFLLIIVFALAIPSIAVIL